jgi:putative inorganic carbon (HCO3(-)) transporter
MGIRDIVVVTFLLASLPACFIRPFYGVVMWTIVAFLNPERYAWSSREFPAALAVAVPTLAGFVIFSRRWNRLFCGEVFMMGVLWVWFSVTTLNSAHDPMFAEKADSAWYHWNLLSKIFLMTAVTIAIVDGWQRLRWLALAIAGSFGFLVVKTLPAIILSDGASRVYGPPNSMIADNNDFGLALNMALPFFFFLAKTESRPWVKRGLAFIFVATIPAILFTYSRGALVGLIAVLLCMLLQAKQKAILVPFAVLVILFASFLTPPEWRARMSHTRPDSLDASALSRLNSWSYSWNLALDNPIMGGGFEAFTPSLYQRYAPDPRDVHGPHSIYFGVLAEHGFTGLFLYLLMVAGCFIRLQKIIRLGHLHADTRAINYANMLRFSLVGFLVSGAFLGRAYFDFFFSVVACVAILVQVCRAEWSLGADSLSEMEPQAGMVLAEAQGR